MVQAQTPQQRKANQKFAKLQENKMGKPESSAVKRGEKQTPPIKKGWLLLLGFVVFGGLIFEFVRLIFARFF